MSDHQEIVMEFEKTVRRTLTVLVMMLVFITVSLARVERGVAEYFRLYELLGAVSALAISVFGLWKMKVTTE